VAKATTHAARAVVPARWLGTATASMPEVRLKKLPCAMQPAISEATDTR
jgi:hypothetical protein